MSERVNRLTAVSYTRQIVLVPCPKCRARRGEWCRRRFLGVTWPAKHLCIARYVEAWKP